MIVDKHKTDLIIQYSVLIAGGEDEYVDRQLGPIHLIKYVYLADLLYAVKNDGKTYTGADWKFHSFGPWSAQVFEQIEPALTAIHAGKAEFESDYEDRSNWVRWSLQNEPLLRELERSIPSSITLMLGRYVHKFKKDTPSLLDFVYKTPPMLNAAPSEPLDFSLVAANQSSHEHSTAALRADSLSNKKRKKFQDRMSELRDMYANRNEVERKLVAPVSMPRYDEVFTGGVDWLDSLSGDRFGASKISAEFTNEVWKSSTRKGSDVPN